MAQCGRVPTGVFGDPASRGIVDMAVLAGGVPRWAHVRPNVEVTGAARLYRAASVWTAGLGGAKNVPP